MEPQKLPARPSPKTWLASFGSICWMKVCSTNASNCWIGLLLRCAFGRREAGTEVRKQRIRNAGGLGLRIERAQKRVEAVGYVDSRVRKPGEFLHPARYCSGSTALATSRTMSEGGLIAKRASQRSGSQSIAFEAFGRLAASRAAAASIKSASLFSSICRSWRRATSVSIRSECRSSPVSLRSRAVSSSFAYRMASSFSDTARRCRAITPRTVRGAAAPR